MKRSAMINKIDKNLRTILDRDLDGYNTAKNFLDFVEKNGMQPPPNETGTFDNSWEPEHEKKLNDLWEIYPNAFLSISKNYGFDRYSFQCENGWYDIIEPIISYIDKYNKENEKNTISIVQVKEKFGGLRFYVNNTTEELQDIIIESESKSFKTCEICGKEGKLIGSSWRYTRCSEHEDK